MSSCNICSYKADYIKDESDNIADVLCGACLDMVEQEAEHIYLKHSDISREEALSEALVEMSK